MQLQPSFQMHQQHEEKLIVKAEMMEIHISTGVPSDSNGCCQILYDKIYC